ncbi:MAG TPA: GNVR domain-containing protein [Terracidiphilus sp.]|jgi:uncharacterized protein involved in exopolysaccharide biosynthesis|nr:GNVR domain-containing protein [Terracidiphilus sp.]
MQNTEQDGFVVEHAEKELAASAAEPVDNDFVVYARRLWEARGFIVKAVLIGAVCSVILAFLLPKQYQSSARLMPPDVGGSQASAMLSALAPGPVADLGSEALGLTSPSAIYVQVLHSRTVQNHLIDQFDLRRVYGLKNYADARAALNSSTETAVDRKSDMVTIMVKAGSPELATELAQGYCDELNRLMVQLDTSSAHRERVFLESRLKGIEDDLQNKSTQLAEYSSKNTVMMGDAQNKAVFDAAGLLRGEAISAKAELVAMEQDYTPDNERVRVARAKVDELNRELAKMRGDNGPVEASADGFPTIRELPLLGVKYTSLYRDLTVQEAVYEALTKQYEMARVDEARDLPTVRVLDEADVPVRKSSPKRTLVLMVGMFLSFMFACALVLSQDWWRDSHSPWRQFAGEVGASVKRDVSRVPGLKRFSKTTQDRTAAV